jgi:hypothetical protein
MARSSRRLSAEEREHRRSADRQRLKDATEQLLCSEGWRRWVRVRARSGLARYSFGNQLLIAFQRPDATRVAGFHAWKELGYQVRRGQQGIRILAPMTVKARDADPRSEETRDEETRVLFRAVTVFDRSQVDPIEGREQAPLDPPVVALTGESHAHLLGPLFAFASTLGFTVDTKPLSGPQGGWCDYAAKQIVVNSDLPANARVRVLVHELAHALGISYEKFGRKRAEVMVDTVTFIVCAGVGLDTGGETIPYVAAWGEQGEVEAVTEFADAIDAIAKQLEGAIAPSEADESPAGSGSRRSAATTTTVNSSP